MILLIVIILLMLMLLFMIAMCITSSKCSRLEEENYIKTILEERKERND